MQSSQWKTIKSPRFEKSDKVESRGHAHYFFWMWGYGAIRLYSRGNCGKNRILQGRTGMFEKPCTAEDDSQMVPWFSVSSRQHPVQHFASDLHEFFSKKDSCLSTFTLFSGLSTRQLLANKNREKRKRFDTIPDIERATTYQLKTFSDETYQKMLSLIEWTLGEFFEGD